MNRNSLIAAVFAALVLGGIAFFLIGDTPETNSPAEPVAEAPTPAPQPEAVPSPAPDTPAPTVTGAPDPEDTQITLLFRRSGQPANQTIVRYLTAEGAPREVRPDSNGRIEWVAGASSLTITDLPTSLTLLQRSDFASPGEVLNLPEPLRLRAEIQSRPGAPASPVTARLGTGRRIESGDRFREAANRTQRKRPDENQPWGIELPLGPDNWRNLSIRLDDPFLTPWFLTTDDPQIIAYDEEGRIIAINAAIPPDIQPYSTIGTPPAMLNPLTALQVEIDLPEEEWNFPIEVGIQEAEPDRDFEQQAALTLSIIDLINPDAVDFSRGAYSYRISPGETIQTIAPLIPFKKLRIAATGLTPRQLPTREIELPYGQVTRVTFTAEDLLPKVEGTATFLGRLLLEGTDTPVDDGMIVASWPGGDRLEFETDSNGEFEIEEVPINLILTFLIEAYDSNDPPLYSHSRQERVLPIGEGNDPYEVTWEIPAFKWLIARWPQSLGSMPDPQTMVLYLEEETEEGWRAFPEVLEMYFLEDSFEVEIRRPGTYRAVLQTSPYVIMKSESAEFESGDFEQYVEFTGTEQPREVTLSIIRPDGSAAANAPIYISPDLLGAEGEETTADENGRYTIDQFNMDSIFVRVELEDGPAFEGRVPVEGNEAVVTLSPEPIDELTGP